MAILFDHTQVPAGDRNDARAAKRLESELAPA
jgi:hypothetical protein